MSVFNSEECVRIVQKVTQKLYSLNAQDDSATLFVVLDKLRIEYTAKEDVAQNTFICDPSVGKILIIGASSVKKNNIEWMLKDLGFSNNSIRKRFDIQFGYEELKTYAFEKLSKYDYIAILAGAIPHSGTEKGYYSSILTSLEKNENYPPVIRLSANSGLKITKTDVELVVKRLIEQGAIDVD